MNVTAEKVINLGPHPQYPKSVKSGIPKLPELKSDWIKVCIGDLFDTVARPVNMQDETIYNLVTVKRSRGGVTEREKLTGKKIAVKSQFYVEGGDFLISKRQIVHGACGFVPEELSGYIVSNEYSVLQCRSNILPDFLNYLMHTPYFQQTCFHSSIGVHVEKMIFKLDDWFKLKIHIPSLDKQKEIATFLNLIDEKLNKLRRKCKLLDAYKRGLMQKLFSQEIRFQLNDGSNFTDWENVKLGEISTIKKGYGLPKSSLQVDGNYKCILYGELFRKYKAVIMEVDSTTNSEEGFRGNYGDILMPTSDVTPSGLATASALMIRDVRLGGDINVVRLAPEVNPVFISYLLNFTKKEIMKLVTGTTVKHIYARDIVGLQLQIPSSIEEQKKIANCLAGLDKKIEAVDQKITQFESFKKGLLQKMFV